MRYYGASSFMDIMEYGEDMVKEENMSKIADFFKFRERNTSYKKARWDFQNPILDPSKDDIDRFLELNLTTGEYSGIKEDERAATTIRHTGINRDALVKARRRIIIRFLKDFKAHQSSGNEKEFCRDWKILKEEMDFPSLYDTLIQAVSD